MSRIRSPHRRWLLPARLRLGWVGLCLAISCGCAGASGGGRPVVCNCRVTVDGQVLQDVHVVLFQEEGSAPLMEGTSDASGLVALNSIDGVQLRNEGSLTLKATVESLGDWEIIAPWSSVDKTPLRVDYSPDADILRIELPKKALKAL